MEINTSSIKKDATKMNEFLQELDKEHKDIKISIETLKQRWKGDKADKFYKQMEETYLVELKKTITLLNNYYEYLNETPGIYETFDNSYASKKIAV